MNNYQKIKEILENYDKASPIFHPEEKESIDIWLGLAITSLKHNYILDSEFISELTELTKKYDRDRNLQIIINEMNNKKIKQKI